MNIWRRGALKCNPYYRTAFRVARVPRETTRRRVVAGLISQTRKIVNLAPHEHVIFREPVTVAELNAAEQILLDPNQRVLEELLHHASESPPLDHLRQLAAEAAARLSPETLSTPGAFNSHSLRILVEHLVDEFVTDEAAPDPSFGALELELAPPFGRRRNE